MSPETQSLNSPPTAECVQDSYAFNNFITGKIIHDLNNRFLSIAGGLQMLKIQQGDNAELTEIIDQIKGQNDKAVDLVMQIRGKNKRDFSGQLPSDISGIIESVSGFWSERAASAGVRMDVEIVDSIGSVDDARMLWVVLGVIVENAIDAAQAAFAIPGRDKVVGIRLTHTTFEETSGFLLGRSSPGTFAVIEVSNNGGPLNTSDPHLIFDPSYSTLSNEHGYSLSLVKDYANRGGRFLDVTSDPDQGVSFKLGIPVTE